MNLDAHRRTVRRLFEEVITKGDYRAADEIFAAIVNAARLERVEVSVRPAHRGLDDVVQAV
jgi:hypothetical protein